MIVKVARLKEYLKENNLTHSDLARTLGLSRSYVSLIINRRRKPSAKFVSLLLRYSGKPFEYFFDVTEENNNERGVIYGLGGTETS
jgi:transcriptional regulator with XRE-family HTH domain